MNVDPVPVLRAFLESVFTRLNRVRAQYAVLRNFRELPDYVRHDIDMAVAPESLSDVEEAIRSAAEETGWAVTGIRDGACLTVFLEHSASTHQLHFDLSHGPRWYCFEFVDWRRILADSIRYKGLNVADAAGEAVVCLMLRLLYGGYVKDEYKDMIRQAAADKAIYAEMQRLLHPWLGDAATVRMLGWAACGDWDTLTRNVGRIRARLIWGNMKRPSLPLRNFVRDLMCLVCRSWTFRRFGSAKANSPQHP